MASKERKEREREEIRELILNAAKDIITEEGIENLSVRKIAGRIEYSPAIIYHYFKDKDDIVTQQMQRGYQKIINALASVKTSPGHPQERLKELVKNYIAAALKMPDEYMAVQLSSSLSILEYTSFMFEGASAGKPALAILHQCLKDIYKDKGISDSQLELTAQILAASSLGLIVKLLREKDIGEEQQSRLIDHYIKCMVDGMILGKPIDEY